MFELAGIFGVSLLSSVHCAGMCGGFAAAVGCSRAGCGAARSLGAQVVYSAGRLFTYMFLGVVGGFAGARLASSGETLAMVQQGFSILAGVALVLVGAVSLGVLRFPAGKYSLLSSLTSMVTPIYRHFLSGKSGAGLLLGGVANGFLPCGLVYAFLALAVAKGTPIGGGLLMLAFGLGTVPIMVASGMGGSLLGVAARAKVYRVAGAVMVVMGAVTIVRGVPSEDTTCCDDVAAGIATAMTLSAPVNASSPNLAE